MRVYVRTIDEKHELEKQGHQCVEMKRVFVNGIIQDYYDWGFDVPDTKEAKQPEPEKRRGNPNWIKKGK